MAEPLTIWIEDGANVAAKAWAARLLARVAGFPYVVRVIPANISPGRGPSIYYGSGFTPDAVVIRPSGFFDGNLKTFSPLPEKPACEVEGVPVVFGGPAWELNEKSIVMSADFLASAFYLVSCMEETLVRDRDNHGRFPAAASFLGKNGLLERPIVDEYAHLLARHVRRLWPDMKPSRPWPGDKSLAVCFSHDIETLACPTRLGYMKHKHLTAIRNLARGVFKDAAVNVGTGVVRGITGHNPSWSFRRLRSTIHPCPGTYYFFGGPTSPKDGQYDIRDAAIRGVIGTLVADGCEIGVHLGYETGSDAKVISAQKTLLETVLGPLVRGTRYHYLRGHFPDAWRGCAAAGLEYDTSLGYAERPGFRAGTSYPFQPFDVTTGNVIDIYEVPLIAMDGTFFQYELLSVDETVSQVMKLADTAALAGGVFTLLWHNTTVDPLDHPGPARAFLDISAALKRMPCWPTTIYGCVDRWRRYCRNLEGDSGGA